MAPDIGMDITYLPHARPGSTPYLIITKYYLDTVDINDEVCHRITASGRRWTLYGCGVGERWIGLLWGRFIPRTISTGGGWMVGGKGDVGGE